MNTRTRKRVRTTFTQLKMGVMVGGKNCQELLPIRHWAEERLGKLTTGELEELSLQLLDAGSLDELLQ